MSSLPAATRLIRATLISSATAAVCFALFVAAAIWAPQDQRAIRAHLVQSIESGELKAQTTLLQRFPVYRNLYNCLLFNMLLAPEPGDWAHAISNHMAKADDAIVDQRVPPFPDCQALWRALPELGGTGAEFIPYDRYLLGMRVAGRVILSVTSVATLRHIQLATSYALLGLAFLLALWKLSQATAPVDRERAAGYAAIAATFMLFFGTYYFDATLNFAALDNTHFLFVLIGLIFPPSAMRPAALAFYGATYGCLIALFEFLTGGIPIALSLLPLLLALGYRGRWPGYAIKLIDLSASFCIAVVMMFAIKKLYAIVLLGDGDDFLGSLLHRTYGELDGRPGVEYSLMFFARIYYGFSSLVALGVPHLGPVLYAASLAALVFVTWRSRRSLGSEDRAVVWACWISLGVLSMWFGVFLNHALLHFFFMVRLLVVPIMVGAVLCATELAARTASPGRQHAAA